MTSHTAHPDTLEAGLADGCPRCAEHAESPLTGLDRPHIEDLWKRMLACEYDPFGPHDYRYRTETEAKACHRLYDHAEFLRSVGVDPHAVTPGRATSSRRRTAGQAAAEIVAKILDHVADEQGYVFSIVRDDDEVSASITWGEGDDAHAMFWSDRNLAACLAFVAEEIGA